MKIIKKIVDRIFTWVNRKRFHKDMKDVLGYESLDALNFDLNSLEREIRNDNEIPIDQKITWDNSKRTNREIFARYYTLKHFSQTGKLWGLLQKELDKKL